VSSLRPPANLVEMLLRVAFDPRVVSTIGQGNRTYAVAGVLVLLGVAQLAGYDVASTVAADPPQATFENPNPPQPAAPAPEGGLPLVLNGLGLATMRSAMGRKSDSGGEAAPSAGSSPLPDPGAPAA
jgi:hypothetical protein